MTGRVTGLGATATAAAAVLGPAVSTYTAALVADTAVPAWHAGHRELPFVFAGSSATAAGGMGLLCGPVGQVAPARRLALAGAALEAVAAQVLEHRGGVAAEPYGEGRAGRMMQAGRVLTVGGLAIAWLGRRHRVAGVVGGGMLTLASAATRAGIFAAGPQSVADPRYVVEPQRERRSAALRDPGAGHGPTREGDVSAGVPTDGGPATS